MKLPSGRSGATVDLAARFRQMAETQSDEICGAIVDAAANGERWACELIMKYAVDQSRDDGAGDRLALVLEELRAAIADRT